ncbi:hypothetical protein LguiB_030975 [Lonicera macranthoides]
MEKLSYYPPKITLENNVNQGSQLLYWRKDKLGRGVGRRVQIAVKNYFGGPIAKFHISESRLQIPPNFRCENTFSHPIKSLKNLALHSSGEFDVPEWPIAAV